MFEPQPADEGASRRRQYSRSIGGACVVSSIEQVGDVELRRRRSETGIPAIGHVGVDANVVADVERVFVVAPSVACRESARAKSPSDGRLY